jgi:hypothetical protein
MICSFAPRLVVQWQGLPPVLQSFLLLIDRDIGVRSTLFTHNISSNTLYIHLVNSVDLTPCAIVMERGALDHQSALTVRLKGHQGLSGR